MNSKNIYMTLWTKRIYPFNVYIFMQLSFIQSNLQEMNKSIAQFR